MPFSLSWKIFMLTVGIRWFCLKCRHSPLAETASSVGAFPCGFISGLKKKKKTVCTVFSLLNEEPLRCLCNWGEPKHRPCGAPQFAFILVFINIVRPGFGKLIGFAWVMSTIDWKCKLIRNCEMFNSVIEDTRRGRGWWLMEQRFLSVSFQQSDLLITHCFGVFYLTLHANWQQGLKIRGGQHSIF